MTVRAGQKIGPYTVVSQVGAGGMGEVYRARDPRLQRDVAIKMLPAAFSSDHDRLRRFAQEARAAAALNHPNILAIFDIGEEQSAPYVVSELLEGETLRNRLRSGALGTRKAIDYSLQILRGLAAAHEKGIIHRDLKPENLFVTADGRIKILDFGLAKLTQPEIAKDSAEAPTLQATTDPGFVMGTLGYMSPEQVRGKFADARSDIFSFGAVLYEMLSGKRAFHGETAADTMSAILKEDPPDLSETGRNVPPGLDRIVNHCLEKSPAQRFQSASDVAFNLESLSDISAGSRTALKTVPARNRSWVRPAMSVIALVAACAAAYLLGSRQKTADTVSFHRLTYRRGTISAARFGPDGQTVVYGAAMEGKPIEIYTTRADSTESRPFGIGTAELLAVSSKGEVAASTNPVPSTFSMSGTLATVSLAGGSPREIVEQVVWADWTPDGSALAVVRGPAGTSNHLEFPANKTIYGPQGWISHVRFSPDGSLLAFADHVPTGDDGRVVIIDRDGKIKATSPFYPTLEGIAWSPSGREVWFTASPEGANRGIYGLSLSGKQRLIWRVPSTLTLQDVARDGRVLMTLDKAGVGMMALPPGEKEERNLSWYDWSSLSDLSADGKNILFDESGEAVGSTCGVFYRKTDGSPAVRLGDGNYSALSLDGKWAAALDLTLQIELLPIGVGQPRRLTHDALQHTAVSWIPDGSGLIYTAHESNQPERSYWSDLNGNNHPVTPSGTSGIHVSPDSKYLLATDEKHKVWLYPLAGGDPLPLPAKLNHDDVLNRFEPDGKSILVRVRGVPTRIDRVFLDSDRRETVARLAPTDAAGVQAITSVRMSDDNKSYAYSYLRTLSELWVVDGLK